MKVCCSDTSSEDYADVGYKQSRVSFQAWRSFQNQERRVQKPRCPTKVRRFVNIKPIQLFTLLGSSSFECFHLFRFHYISRYSSKSAENKFILWGDLSRDQNGHAVKWLLFFFLSLSLVRSPTIRDNECCLSLYIAFVSQFAQIRDVFVLRSRPIRRLCFFLCCVPDFRLPGKI